MDSGKRSLKTCFSNAYKCEFSTILRSSNHKTNSSTFTSSQTVTQPHISLPNCTMAFPSKLCFFVLFAFVFIRASLGEVVCEDLPRDKCALAISSSGRRCLLEKYRNENGETAYQCKTSEVMVWRMSGYIESDECVKSCGVDRNMVGFSSDNLLEPHFTAKLCSPACFRKCPNIIDLYFKLAEGEGVYLPDLCKRQRSNPRRAMVELMSSGVAPGPISESLVADAPALPPSSTFN